MAQNNPGFNGISYGLLEDFNEGPREQDITDIDESLYESALDTNRLAMNCDTEEIIIRDDKTARSGRRKDTIMNTTIYKRKDTDNHNNKYVDTDTMNSYLSITDLQDNARDNVNIVRSNLQKINERDDRLEDLDAKSEFLMEGSDKFNRRSDFLKNKMFWAHLFNYLLIIFFILLIIFLIIKLR